LNAKIEKNKKKKKKKEDIFIDKNYYFLYTAIKAESTKRRKFDIIFC
jgi:rRNA pseudouridine-1189 N-methylase Emg1 (Nep1/Mra1 family)